MDGSHETWIRHSVAQEERVQLSEALKGWWKLAHPVKAWRLYRRLRGTSDASRRAGNERLLRKRLTDPALRDLNEDQRRAIIVQYVSEPVTGGDGRQIHFADPLVSGGRRVETA